MESYFSLARYYDALTRDVDYGEFAEIYEKIFRLYGKNPKTILDLACGTGTLTGLLARSGYELIGADMSEEMLAVAAEKDYGGCGTEPVFINQSMQELDLYGTVDAAVCSLDGINYIPPEDIDEVFRRLGLFIEPGGLFIFDINSPYKLKNLDGEMFVDETEDVYCVWRAEYDREEAACFYGMDIFMRQGEHWDRSFEEHTEYIHEPERLVSALKRRGFSDIRMFGDDAEGEPREDTERIFIAAVNDGIDQIHN